METTTALAGHERREPTTGRGVPPARYGALALVAIAGLAAVGPLLLLRLAVAGSHPWIERLVAAGRAQSPGPAILVTLGWLAFLAATMVAVAALIRAAEAGETAASRT